MKRIAACLAILALGACSRADPLPVHLDIKTYDGCACTQAAIDVAWSLDHEGDKWHGDSYRISRYWTGTSIWVANRDYGLTVSSGLSSPSAFEGDEFKLDRALIWHAYQRWALGHAIR